MKLYYSPGACALYTAINPKGYVPALLLNDGQVLTEGLLD